MGLAAVFGIPVFVVEVDVDKVAKERMFHTPEAAVLPKNRPYVHLESLSVPLTLPPLPPKSPPLPPLLSLPSLPLTRSPIAPLADLSAFFPL